MSKNTTREIKVTFNYDTHDYTQWTKAPYYTMDDTNITKEDWLAAKKAYDDEVAASTPEAPAEEGTPEAHDDVPAEKKAKTHPTADAFLKDIPETYIFRTNAKGHILISKAEGDKTAYARIRPLKDGAYIFPGKELKATRTDWEFHKGWANEYALKVSNWDEVTAVLNF